jgi:hypothetical protein
MVTLGADLVGGAAPGSWGVARGEAISFDSGTNSWLSSSSSSLYWRPKIARSDCNMQYIIIIRQVFFTDDPLPVAWC